MAIIQYLDKRGLGTLIKEINKRTSSVYVIKGSAIYADAAFIANKSSITEFGDITAINSVGLWQKQSGSWVKITEVKIGWVYNIENNFKTDTDFLEGTGHDVEAGTNIVVVDVGTGTVKWDLLAMSLSLDAYQTKALVAAIDVFAAGTSTPIKVTAVASSTALPDTDGATEYDVAICNDTKDVYRFNGTAWVKIGDQVTVEGSLELLSKVAPNTPISDNEIKALFDETD